MASREGFWKAWDAAEAGPPKLVDAFKRAMEFLEMGTVWWDVRVSTSDNDDFGEGTFMATISTDGNEAFFLVTEWFTNLECRDKGLLVAATILHEALEVFEWAPDTVTMASDTRRTPMTAVRAIRHHQLDKLAWLLVPHVFPDLNPTEDFFNADDS